MKMRKGQGLIGAGVGFIMLALSLVIGVIAYIILNTVIGANAANFTGINGTISTYIPTLFLVGILVGGAMSAFIVMRGFGGHQA